MRIPGENDDTDNDEIDVDEAQLETTALTERMPKHEKVPDFPKSNSIAEVSPSDQRRIQILKKHSSFEKKHI